MDSTTQEIGGKLTFPALYQWAVALFKSPRAFFAAMERKGGYMTPCLYLLAWSFVSGVIGFLVGLTRAPLPGAGRAVQAASVVVGPPLVLGFGFAAAAVLFVIWHLMGSKEDYQTAFRCWAFMAPVGVIGAVLGLVPLLPLAVFFYTFYLVVVASQEVHGLSPRRSWAVWGTLGGVILVASVALVAATALIQKRGGGRRNMPGVPYSSPVGEP
jgi:hypothetical protein